jgi:hypothetical protein
MADESNEDAEVARGKTPGTQRQATGVAKTQIEMASQMECRKAAERSAKSRFSPDPKPTNATAIKDEKHNPFAIASRLIHTEFIGCSPLYEPLR